MCCELAHILRQFSRSYVWLLIVRSHREVPDHGIWEHISLVSALSGALYSDTWARLPYISRASANVLARKSVPVLHAINREIQPLDPRHTLLLGNGHSPVEFGIAATTALSAEVYGIQEAISSLVS